MDPILTAPESTQGHQLTSTQINPPSAASTEQSCEIYTDDAVADLFSWLNVNVQVTCDGTRIATVSYRDVVEDDLSGRRPIIIELYFTS